MGQIIITDASVLLNILASGKAGEILQGVDQQFVVCPSVVNEVKLLKDQTTGEVIPVSLAPFIDSGVLQLVEPETDEEFDLLVQWTSDFGLGGDGEAMCFALAQPRHYSVAIDDRRAIGRAERFYPDFTIIGTTSILIQWQKLNQIPRNIMETILKSITERARYTPSKNHPDKSWWDSPDY